MEGTFGIEEEFMIVDPVTLAPVPEAARAIAAIADAVEAGSVTSEFLPSQIEYATPVCRSPPDAWYTVLGFRHALGAWADSAGLVIAPSGTPWQIMPEEPDIVGRRYRRIARDVGRLSLEHLVNGMHVHVGISDPEEGIRVINGLRLWLPLLLGLSANSPFWAGSDTGHHSWRSIQTRRWTTYGIPPHLGDAAEYRRLHARLTGIGATQDYCTASWSVRLSENFPTVEVRVCDTQLTARATLGLALVIRALAHRCGEDLAPAIDDQVLDAELWHAGRYGVTGGAYSPAEDAHTTMRAALTGLRRTIAEHAAAQTSSEIIDDFLREVTSGQGPAQRQRRTLRRAGTQGLAALYRESLADDSGAFSPQGRAPHRRPPDSDAPLRRAPDPIPAPPE